MTVLMREVIGDVLRRARIDAYREVLASGLRPTPITSSHSND